MDPKWGKVEYVDKVAGMFYEKMNPEMKKAYKKTQTKHKPE